VEEIQQLLVEEESNMQELKQRENSDSAMLVRRTPTKKPFVKNVRRFSPHKRMTCHQCGSFDHKQDECKMNKWKCYNCGQMTDSHDPKTINKAIDEQMCYMEVETDSDGDEVAEIINQFTSN
jgi:hypothetical protein